MHSHQIDKVEGVEALGSHRRQINIKGITIKGIERLKGLSQKDFLLGKESTNNRYNGAPVIAEGDLIPITPTRL